MRKYFILYIMLTCLPMAARGQTITDLADIDLSGLPQPTTAKALRYWFDDDNSNVKTTNGTSGSYLLDASNLIEGLHTLHYQIIDDRNIAAYVGSSIFLKMNGQLGATSAKTLRYWFDDETAIQNVDISLGTQMLDASALIGGLHTIHYQIADSKGMLGAPYSSLFLKMDVSSSSIAQSLRYWFDDDAATMATTSVTGGTQTLDVSNLLIGLHTLHYQLIDEQGQVTAPVTRFFIKNFDKVIEGGQNRITKYQYWLNRNSQALQTVNVNAATNPYTLITLLPMQQEPIQSSQFHFEVTDGTPTIYAKNTFHIRFHDAASYFKNGEKKFIDYRVKQVVEPVGELLPTQTFQRVEENSIRWYTINAEAGDSLTFRSNQATTIQLFSPTGKELYSASGSISVTYGGSHTWESGTHYLAVHDVTGSKNDMTLDYHKIDCYAILASSPNTIGVPSESVINISGNGFNPSVKVALFKDGIDYWANDIYADCLTELSALFNFDDIPYGQYGIKVVYTPQDSVLLPNAITIEDADDQGDIDIKLEGNPFFLAGSSATYNIKVTNNSNTSIFSLPITLSIECEGDVNNVPYLKFEQDFTAPSRQSLRDSYYGLLSSEELKELEHYIFGDNDLSMFYIDTISDPGKAFLVGNFVIPQIEGNSTFSMPFTLKKINHGLTIYAATQKHWEKGDFINLEALNENEVKRMKSRRRASSKDCMDPCSLGVIANCLITITENAMPVGFDELLGDCFKGYVKEKFGGIFSDIVCNGETFDFSKIPKTPSPVLEDISVSMLQCARDNLIKHGVVAFFGKMIGGKILKVYNVAKDCTFQPLKSFAGKCDDEGDGNNATPINSWDPNDIYGYLSEAGSKFIADSVERVNFTIEFENDTAFATAAAHTIVIRDTLDSRYFDRSVFAPTGVRIGEHEMFLEEKDVATKNGRTTFIKTIDMRPEINAIAQVEGEYSQQTGIVTWTFTSLDPMTMEPADDLMQGILPVNYNGTSGIGEVMFEVGVKPNKGDGTEIKNRAGIVFDYEETILTPTWTNTVDAVAPTSRVTGVEQVDSDTLQLYWTGEDARSGIWYYDVYAQMGAGSSWELVAEHVSANECKVRVYEDIEYGFCVVATDMAGNRERKVLSNELLPDTPTDVESLSRTRDEATDLQYDLSGRRSDGRHTGVYIQGGRLWYFKR